MGTDFGLPGTPVFFGYPHPYALDFRGLPPPFIGFFGLPGVPDFLDRAVGRPAIPAHQRASAPEKNRIYQPLNPWRPPRDCLQEVGQPFLLERREGPSSDVLAFGLGPSYCHRHSPRQEAAEAEFGAKRWLEWTKLEERAIRQSERYYTDGLYE
jgi:hypothetical protein